MLERLHDIFIKKIPKRRHKDWPKARKAHVIRQPFCQACGAITKLQVHHIKPFYLFPDLELIPSNLVTLCMTGKKGIKCHLLVGHVGRWKRINVMARQDARIWFGKIK